MRVFFPSHLFFFFSFFHSLPLYIYVNCPMCSINAEIVHGGDSERYTTHRTLSHERVREWTA